MENPNILLITPPLTQLNTPYPATAYLKGFLSGRGYKVRQADLGIELVLCMFSKAGLQRIFSAIEEGDFEFSDNSLRMLRLKREYLQTIEPVIRFLQNQDSTLAQQISYSRFLPEASRFDQVEDIDWAFGSMGITDRARYLATLYLEDLGDLIKDTICPYFAFSRYADKLAMSATTFDPLENALQETPNLIDEILLELLEEHLQKAQPGVVGFSIPFPGNVYGGLRLAQYIKQKYPHIKTMMGGGYPNTELRSLREPRLFKYIDFVTLDDGEGPWLKLLEHLQRQRPLEQLQRAFALVNGEVTYINNCSDSNVPHTEIGTPDYSDLPLQKYLSVIDVINPMHRLWSDGRWNKLTIAHGCYWKRCSFCDITLDYINRYDVAPATLLVDRMEQIIAQTGQTGFHFVDEAAPPAPLRDMAIELIRRGVKISWWGNIRFEKTFTPDLCRLLAASGCIAVSGGLEVASDRLLELMEKGVSIEQVARVTDAFTQAGIMVHAYLMYGFPTETAQETVDSLEVVRQLFINNVIQSGYWHRFSMTAHSPVGKNPEKYGVVKVGPEEGPFANNDLWHEDPQGTDHEMFGPGLAKAIYNYMHGVALEQPLSFWFDFKVPRTKHRPDLIYNAIQQAPKPDAVRRNARVLWLGGVPEIEFTMYAKKGQTLERCLLTFFEKAEDYQVKTTAVIGQWLFDALQKITPDNQAATTLKQLEASFPAEAHLSFDEFLSSPTWFELREKDLLLL
ncbi:B12-binding domain-containing radical SAM protein [Pontibacter silvestris]|uniref:B12-binding domain-containing radical SAM protein n=1 Tax=Pontibacter silvestris TaxID=2305183 RepID=A0ABW4WY43_9BACT|nr:radical SAM protein [Pontibacter silvestris]MCC9137577.1 radical SAM protein [Pontibacter silvestris]